MSNYGFTIQVNNLASTELKKIQEAIKGVSSTAKVETGQIQDSFVSLGDSAQKMGRYIIEAFSIYEIYSFGKELMHLAAEFQGFDNVIKYSSEGIVDNANNINYLNDAITRLHLPMKETYQSFSEMQAGFYGTGIEGDKLRKVFEGVAEASTVLHLTPDKFSNVTFALKEIGELGTLQMRQMRMLAFALPGSMNIAAQAMGMTTEQLHAAMKKGQIQSSVFLPKFAEALTQHFHPGLANAGKSLISQINDEKNSLLKLMLDMGNSLMPLWLDILQTVSNVFKEIKTLWDGLTGNSNFVNFLKMIFDWAVKLIPIWITYKAIMIATGIATSIFSVENGTLTASLGEVTVMTDGTTVAMEGLSSAIASTGIGALVIGLGLAIEKFIEWNSQIKDTADGLMKIGEITSKFQQTNKVVQDIQLATSNWANLSKDQKQSIINDAHQALSGATADTAKLFNPGLRRNRSERDSTKSLLDTVSGSSIPILRSIPLLRGRTLDSLTTITDRMNSNVDTTAKAVTGMSKNISVLNDVIKKGVKEGIIPTNKPSGGKGIGGGETAINTSNLAGASGGLGSAKTVNIRIDTFQKNEGVRESKSQADQAIEKLTELINGFISSENAQ